MRQSPSSFFGHVTVLLSQCHLLNYSFPVGLSWQPCQKSFDYRHLNLFLDSQFSATDLYTYFMTVPHCRMYCYFLVSLEVGNHESCGSPSQTCTSPFYVLGLLIFSPWVISILLLIALVRTSRTVLNGSGEHSHPCHVPNVRGKHPVFYH